MTDTMLLWHTREFSLLLQGRHHATCGNMPLPARWVVFFHRFWRGLERFLGKLCSFSATLEIHSMICVAWKSILTHMLCIYVQKCEFNRSKHTQNKWKYIDWYGSPNRPCPLLIQLAVVNDHWMHRKAVWESWKFLLVSNEKRCVCFLNSQIRIDEQMVFYPRKDLWPVIHDSQVWDCAYSGRLYSH